MKGKGRKSVAKSEQIVVDRGVKKVRINSYEAKAAGKGGYLLIQED